jgi:hypothetical protein
MGMLWRIRGRTLDALVRLECLLAVRQRLGAVLDNSNSVLRPHDAREHPPEEIVRALDLEPSSPGLQVDRELAVSDSHRNRAIAGFERFATAAFVVDGGRAGSFRERPRFRSSVGWR